MSRSFLSDRPLALRIGAALTLGAGLTALFVCVAMLGIAWWTAEAHELTEAQDAARALSFALRAPVSFVDDAGVRDAVEVARARPQVRGVWVFDSANMLLYAWGTPSTGSAVGQRGSLADGWLQVSESIVSGKGGEQLGRVELLLDQSEPLMALRRQAVAAAVAGVAGLVLALALSRRLARRIAEPVVQLAEAAEGIARDRDYAMRLPDGGGSREVGVALSAFNQMLAEVQKRDEALGQANRQLLLQAQDAQQARRQAEGASQAKSRFLANMSHELRSPLNGVIGAAQLLQLQGDDPARRQALVEIIRTSGNNLLGLIEGVLDLARIESGAMQVVAEDFHLPDCVAAALQSSAATAQAKGLRLTTRLDPAIVPWRHGDGGRLRQLLMNLLGNAVKFTAQGEVSVRVCPGQREDELLFEVRDTGVGIPADALDHIFEPFQQADASTTRRFGGSGLGLAICRELAERMGGSMAVASRPGAGSCFTLALPLPAVAGRGAEPAGAAVVPDAAVSAHSPSPAPAGGGHGRVLVVEDDPINQTVVCAMLAHAGWQAVVADGGLVALDLLRAERFDLVLMDWQMPDLDGLETTRRLRAGAAGEAARTVPVVALTANAFTEDRQTCLAAGMDDFLTKPVVAAQLLAVAQRWATAAARTGAAPTLPATPTALAAANEAPVFDPAPLAALPMVADGSRPGYADELLALFERCADTDLAAAEAALAASDRIELQRRCHTLKANAAQVGALALSAEAARQELHLRAGHAPEPDGVERLKTRLATVRAHLAERRRGTAPLPMSAPMSRTTANDIKDFQT